MLNAANEIELAANWNIELNFIQLWNESQLAANSPPPHPPT